MKHLKIVTSGCFLGILLFFVILKPAFSDQSENRNCLKCHDDVWNESLNQRFVHLPFQQQECETCHLSDDEKQNQQENLRQNQQYTKLVGNHYTPSRVHWFNFPAAKVVGSNLMIEARGYNRKVNREKRIELPPLEDLKSYDDDKKPPNIHDVKVLAVEKGIYFTATIGWKTDKVSTSKVTYGEGRLNMTSPLEMNYTSDHKVTLTAIKPDRTYQFSVESEDVFGNKSISNVFTLSTDEIFSHKGENDENPLSLNEDLGLEYALYKRGNNYILKLTANAPVSITLGTFPKKSITVQPDMGKGKHVIVKSKFEMNLSVCYKCHSAYKQGASHPVNVYPKPGMVVPPEYSTLEDGRITCMSCHASHASNREHRVIKSSKKELCIGCHKDMI